MARDIYQSPKFKLTSLHGGDSRGPCVQFTVLGPPSYAVMDESEVADIIDALVQWRFDLIHKRRAR